MALMVFIIISCACISSLETVVAFDNDRFRHRLVKAYFDAGYTYNLIIILCFLAGIHGIMISLRTLKRLLRWMNLGRRGAPCDLRTVARYFMVSFKFLMLLARYLKHVA